MPVQHWVDFLKRSARTVDLISEAYKMDEWVKHYRRTKWRFAGHLIRKMDNRWSKAVLNFKPGPDHRRRVGHPRMRWSDDIVTAAGSDWMVMALDEEEWTSTSRRRI